MIDLFNIVWTECLAWLKETSSALENWNKAYPFLGKFVLMVFSGCGFLLWHFFRKSKEPETQKETSWSEDQRKRLIKRIQSDVKARRAHQLHDEVTAQLQRKQVSPRFKVARTTQDEQVLEDGTSILEVYDHLKVQQKLLILGDPGAGKTTVLLELAEHLVEKAENDVNEPVPVIFECSNWKEQSDARDWLAEEMKNLFKLKIKQAKQLLEQEKILIFLDGLDELNLKQQKKFVTQLNALVAEQHALVICSRIREYELIRKSIPLKLNNAVKIEPLEDASVFKYLKEIQCADLIPILDQPEHHSLLELVKKPLFLNILILVKDQLYELPSAGKSENYEKILLDYFLDNRLERLQKEVKKVSTDKVKKWLKWLAIHMKDKDRSEFYLEDLQPTMLKDPAPFGLFVTFVVMLIFGLAFGLAEGLKDLDPSIPLKTFPNQGIKRSVLN